MSDKRDFVRIFDMTEKEIAFVTALERKVFSHPWVEAEWKGFFEKDFVVGFVAEFKGDLVGYCGVSISYETADLCRIAVDPQFRRRGIASALLTEMVSYCYERRVESVLLEVRRHNEGAIALYRGQGFEEIHVRKNYYTDPPDDAVVMQRLLPAQ